MTWSFLIRNGDLSFSGPGGFAQVQGQQKLVQDLKNWLLEPRGTDPMHPDYGCILDGGTLPDGSIANSMIGELLTSEALVEVESEVRRILQAYQQQQLDRLTDESARYGGKNTFSAGEILAAVLDVTTQQIADTVVVVCSIQTADGNEVTFAQPVT